MAKEKHYRLSDERSGKSCMIMVGKKGNLTVFNEDTKERQAIRHCPNQKTIYRDKQDEYALVEPIIFMGGILNVPDTQPITQQFLDAHPSNMGNGGTWFESINEEEEAKEDIILEELIIAIKSEVMQKAKEKDGIHELSAIVAVLTGSIEEAMSLGIESLKREIYKEIELKPFNFTDDAGNVNIFDDHETQRSYLVLRALKDGIIKKSFNNKSMSWYKGGEVIATAPASIDLITYFTDFLTTDEGIKVAEEIVRRS